MSVGECERWVTSTTAWHARRSGTEETASRYGG